MLDMEVFVINKFFKILALFLLLSAVIVGIFYPLLLFTEDATLLNRIYGSIMVVLPLLAGAAIFWGIAIILDILFEIKSKL